MTQHCQPQASACGGFLNVLKPPGMTSAQVVARVRRMLNGEKVGHAGTLDPEAAGVLPLMIGKAARLFDYLQEKQKGYLAEVAFGQATDTQDAQGTVVATGDCYPDEATLRAALQRFRGAGVQVPPMYSALKQDGKRLYDVARSGGIVEREPRPVTVYTLDLAGMTPRHGALLSLTCSKGFYVRTLCHDLGLAVGCPAHMRFLLRVRSGVFALETARTLEELLEAREAGNLEQCLLPMDTAVGHLTCLSVPSRLGKAFHNGVPLPVSAIPEAASLSEGQPARLLWDGALTAIGTRQGNSIRARTWLGD